MLTPPIERGGRGFVFVAILASMAAAADERPLTVTPPVPVVGLPAPPAPPPPPEPASPYGIKSLVGLFSVEDYPVQAIRAGQQGMVQVRLMVTTEGSVGNCQVMVSSGSIWLDRATCQILQRRARFKPARDANGRPTIDYYTQKVRWDLPPEPLPFVNTMERIVVRLDDEGNPTSCGYGQLVKWLKPEECAQYFLIARQLLLGRLQETKGMSLAIERYFEANPASNLLPKKLTRWEKLLARATVEFDIDPAGTPQKCRQLAREGGPMPGDLCMSESRHDFAPLDDKDKTRRRGRTTLVGYLEPLLIIRQIDPPPNPR